jgi:hypothetical protein
MTRASLQEARGDPCTETQTDRKARLEAARRLRASTFLETRGYARFQLISPRPDFSSSFVFLNGLLLTKGGLSPHGR